jgi:hypothetical protein
LLHVLGSKRRVQSVPAAFPSPAVAAGAPNSRVFVVFVVFVGERRARVETTSFGGRVQQFAQAVAGQRVGALLRAMQGAGARAARDAVKVPDVRRDAPRRAAAERSQSRLREVSLNESFDERLSEHLYDAGVAAGDTQKTKRRKVMTKPPAPSVYLELKHLREHLLPLLPPEKIATLPSGSTLINIGDGRTLFFASQDAMFNNAVVKVNGIVQKNQDWLDERLKCVWTGSTPSSATFYSWYHPVVVWQLNNRVSGCYDYASFDCIKDLNVLDECLSNFKHLPSVFGQASKYYMSVGSDLEDTAIKLYVKQYCPDGVAVEEFLRTAPYSAANPQQKQGGSPDLMLVLPNKTISGEVKCAAACQNATCKRKRSDMARRLRRKLKQRVAACDECCDGAAQEHWDAILQEMPHTSYSVTTDADEVLDETRRLTDIVYCRDDAHKTPHKEIKAYYVVQMMLEMFHQCTLMVVMICYGIGAGINAFRMMFDFTTLAAGALYMQTERELAARAAEIAQDYGNLKDPTFDEKAFVAGVLADRTFNMLNDRAHQNQELMGRMSYRACLGGAKMKKYPRWCPFYHEWNQLDKASKCLLRNAWVDKPPADAMFRRRKGVPNVYERIRDAYCPSPDKVRTMDFERPDPKHLMPLTLRDVKDSYEAFCDAHDGVKESESTPPPIHVVAPLLKNLQYGMRAAVGFVTEPIAFLPERTMRPLHVPNFGGKVEPHKTRWQFKKCKDPETLEEYGFLDEELCFDDVFPHPVEGETWLFKRFVFDFRRNMKAPLGMGVFDDDGSMCMNYHGEVDDALPVSAEDIPSGTPVRFVVQQFGSYRDYHWAEIVRVLVHKNWEAEVETEPEDEEARDPIEAFD